MKKFTIVTIILWLAMSGLSASTVSIQEKTAGMKKFSGYIPFYWDESSGRIWLEINRLEEEFLYYTALAAGLGSNAIGLDRNQLGSSKIVSFFRIGPRIFLMQPNYGFRAESDNPDERRAVRDAFATSVVWGFPIAAEENGNILVDATEFFLQDVHNAAGSLQGRNQGNFRLDASRSSIYPPNTRNFPFNTEVEVLLTFVSNNPGWDLRSVAVDPGAVTLRMHHSLVRLPDEGFQSRTFDPRSNFSSVSFHDYATSIDEPLVKRFIALHRLQKKNPSAKISEPIEPIVYYVDSGVPEPIRSALVEGALWWNEAFTAIGYKNAFQVEVLPEGADPLDIRYNMINWVHRSSRGWSYGASIQDPRTGEIIKGHVALGSLRIRQDYLIAQALAGNFDEFGDNSKELREMALARIRQLSCHEVGHTLGLGHNYASSVNDRASVMDYPHPLILFKEDGTLDLSNAYDTGIGEWDTVSIHYGYQDFPKGVNEEEALRDILDEALSSGLHFLAGQDAGPSSAHPLAASWDNGQDPVDELERVLRVRAIALQSFSEKRIPLHTPLALLEDVLLPVYLFHRYQVEAAASVLGGVDYTHKLRGDVQHLPQLVSGERQRRALEMLLKTLSPETLVISESILNLIPPRPPGYRDGETFPGYTGDTFDFLAAAETAADITLGLILHPHRASRLVEQSARDKSLPGLSEVLDRLTSVLWTNEGKDAKSIKLRRVVDHVFLFRLMDLALSEEASHQARAEAAYQLEKMKIRFKGQWEKTEDSGWAAHCFYGFSTIRSFQENPDRFLRHKAVTVPQGAPIGTVEKKSPECLSKVKVSPYLQSKNVPFGEERVLFLGKPGECVWLYDHPPVA
ncbi:MAG: zinc-dependent metalloprotease, partial [Candidatus Aminicenantes bacterium]|nr:zinc-dependent metalloprotease [Candidatus Aminicenantes bacterium]